MLVRGEVTALGGLVVAGGNKEPFCGGGARGPELSVHLFLPAANVVPPSATDNEAAFHTSVIGRARLCEGARFVQGAPCFVYGAPARC
ncbi:hypothetical protein GCM10009872_48060 [Actinopolymorpha rutila]